MISVTSALDKIFALLRPLETETVSLHKAAGRVLAKTVIAARDQPPFDASVMDGYGIPDAIPEVGARYQIVGEAAAGHAFDRRINPGETVRIFTGAPVPAGVERIIIQEDVRCDDSEITLSLKIYSSIYIRRKGADFNVGNELCSPRRLSAADIALIASMNKPEVTVYRRPKVALIATGDELVMPGEVPTDDQIIASNTFGLAALVESAGGIPHVLPIARDTEESLEAIFQLAKGADLIVTIGGASVGDHDLVGQVASKIGMERAFYNVAMRPGKPLMAGLLDGTPIIGLPGNPVSSLVCGQIFMLPALDVLQGQPARPISRRLLPLAAAITANGPREHYMRASVSDGEVTAATRQDSALLSVLSTANALIARAPNDTAREPGAFVEVIDLL
ncbi:MAG: molybdopterin molybdotransferase MoeA [Boseongicola sp.]